MRLLHLTDYLNANSQPNFLAKSGTFEPGIGTSSLHENHVNSLSTWTNGA